MTAPVADPLAGTESPCFPIIGTRGIRVTLVDGCGKPVYGPNSTAVSKGIVSIEMEPETEEGEEYSQTNAAGEQCFPAFTGPSTIKWWTITLEFCNVDPALFTLINTAWKQVKNWSGDQITGWRMGSNITNSEGLGFALETWPRSAGSGVAQVCDNEGNEQQTTNPGGYFLLPFLVPGAPDSWTLENEPSTFTLTAKTKAGSLWKRGPYDIVMNEDGPGPLVEPIDPGFKLKPADDPNGTTGVEADHFHAELTTVPPPAFGTCGRQPLWNPDATAPEITVAAADGDPTKATLTVSNLEAIGGSGTVYWGDGTTQKVDAQTTTKTDPYPESALGTEQTIRFQPANNAKPATAAFTPEAAPEITGITIAPATESIAAGASQEYTVTSQPGDADVTADATLTVAPDNAGVSASGSTVTATADATAQDYTVTATYTAPSGDVTSEATLTVTAAEARRAARR